MRPAFFKYFSICPHDVDSRRYVLAIVKVKGNQYFWEILLLQISTAEMLRVITHIWTQEFHIFAIYVVGSIVQRVWYGMFMYVYSASQKLPRFKLSNKKLNLSYFTLCINIFS